MHSTFWHLSFRNSINLYCSFSCSSLSGGAGQLSRPQCISESWLPIHHNSFLGKHSDRYWPWLTGKTPNKSCRFRDALTQSLAPSHFSPCQTHPTPYVWPFFIVFNIKSKGKCLLIVSSGHTRTYNYSISSWLGIFTLPVSGYDVMPDHCMFPITVFISTTCVSILKVKNQNCLDFIGFDYNKDRTKHNTNIWSQERLSTSISVRLSQ